MNDKDRCTAKVQSMVTPEEREVVRDAAQRNGRSVSNELRRMIRRVYLADQVTVEQARTLVDTREPYVTHYPQELHDTQEDE